MGNQRERIILIRGRGFLVAAAGLQAHSWPRDSTRGDRAGPSVQLVRCRHARGHAGGQGQRAKPRLTCLMCMAGSFADSRRLVRGWFERAETLLDR